MDPTVGDLMGILESLAPSDLAEDWDNVGLQVGSRHWPVRRVVVALDPSPDVVADACREGADLLVTHHPLTLKTFRRLDLDTPFGAVVSSAVDHRLAVVAAHTNLDSASGGINDLLAERLGLESVIPLVPARVRRAASLLIWLPADLETAVTERLDAGGAAPSVPAPSREATGPAARRKEGRDGLRRIVRLVSPSQVPLILQTLAKAFPDAPIQYEVRPFETVSGREGMGRVGVLPAPVDLAGFAAVVQDRLGPSILRRVGPADRLIRRVAVCSGSGGSLLEDFFASEADLFITGDIRYHDARTIEERGRCLLDVGHFESEHLITASLKARLEARMAAEGWNVDIRVSTVEQSPFQTA